VSGESHTPGFLFLGGPTWGIGHQTVPWSSSTATTGITISKRRAFKVHFRLITRKSAKNCSALDSGSVRATTIGQVDVRQGAKVYADSRKFLDTLKKTDPRISVHLGRIERHTEENQAAKEILRYVNSLTMQINSQVFSQLVTFVKMHERTTIWVEKAVDVNLAIDMVTMAINDDYDAAYILSADGDFTKAVEFVRGRGKKVYAVSFGMGAQLAGAVNKFIPLKPDWLTDCY